MLIEGLPELRRAVDAGHQIEELYVADELPEDLNRLDLRPVRLSDDAAGKVFMRERGGRVIGIIQMPAFALADLPAAPTAVVLAEGLEKPGNWGAILRTADAAGIDAVVAIDPIGDIASPNVVRASLGTIFSLPVATAPLSDTLDWCGEHGLSIVALVPSASVSLFETDLRPPTALAVGAEHDGLSSGIVSAADSACSLPMAGSADSLNASVAAAVALYEMVRQRSEAASPT